jgi:hypothetical protein
MIKFSHSINPIMANPTECSEFLDVLVHELGSILRVALNTNLVTDDAEIFIFMTGGTL